MNQLSRVFQYQGAQVRTVIKDGEPWFIAKDVCEVLDIVDARQAVNRLDDDERCLIPVTDSLGRLQPTFAVNEPGLYTLILRSRKSEAREFKRWITHEVLPSIRRSGQYQLQQMSQMEMIALIAKQAAEKEKEDARRDQQIASLQAGVTQIQETIIQRDEDWRNWINKMFNNAVIHTRGKDFKAIRTESYKMLEQRARCDLDARLRNLRDRLEREGATKSRMNSLTKMDVIEADVRLKEIYTSIVKELSIKLVPLGSAR